MGAIALDVGRPREAIRIIRQSDPNRGELKGWSSYYQLLVIAHLCLGEYDAALDAVRRVQADHPGLDVGAQLAMRTFAILGRASAVDSVLKAALLLDESETIVRELIAELPVLMNPLTSLGRSAARRGDAATVAEIDRLLEQEWQEGFSIYADL